MTAVAQYDGQLYVAPLTSSTTFTQEATTGDAGRTAYTINAAAKRYWDRTATLTVEKNIGAGYVTVSAADYTVEYLGGVVDFKVALPAGAAVRVSGKYLTYAKYANINTVSWTLEEQLQRMTDYNERDHDYAQVISLGSGTLTILDADGYYSDLAHENMVLIHHFSGTYNTNDSSGPKMEMYIRLKGLKTTMPGEDLTGQEVGFEIIKERHWRNS